MPSLTTTQLRAIGAAAAEARTPIYEASIRSGLTSVELIEFEAGYFKRQFEAQGQGVSGVDEGCFVHDADLLFISRAKVRNCSQQG